MWNLTLFAAEGRAEPPAPLRFRQEGDQWHLEAGAQSLGAYVTRDKVISRPFWCNLKTTGGAAVTRPYPLGAGELDDHPTMHPGLWIAFGDVDGYDVWRLKSPVQHESFIEPPRVTDGIASFTVRNVYRRSAEGDPILIETSRWTARLVDDGWLLTVAARFHGVAADEDVLLGDQEEMGLGVRLTRALAERSPSEGTLGDADGRATAARIWGQSSAWCDGGRTIAGRRMGLTIYPSTDNFRPCWWHVRDSGLMVANPFGRQALTGGERSQVAVSPGRPLDLRFAIRVYDSTASDAPAAFRDRAAAILETASLAE